MVKMIASIQLENFQAHEARDVEFSPTITTIQGASDLGKSAILRALRWACLNDLPGSDFVTEGEKNVTVTVTLSDGTRITRSKNKDGSDNLYSLDGTEFKSFGQGVPTDIAATLNLNEINFQGQHDAPFWFSETAGEVSRRLNAVIDLSVIDTTLSNIASAVTTARGRRDVSQERLQSVSEEWEAEKSQRARVTEFEELKGLHEKHVAAKENFDSLARLLEGIGANKSNALIRRAEFVSNVFTLARQSVQANRRVNALANILSEIEEAENATVAPPSFAGVEKSFDAWQDSVKAFVALEILLEKITRSEEEALYAGANAEEMETRFHKHTKGMNCPTCGQII